MSKKNLVIFFIILIAWSKTHAEELDHYCKDILSYSLSKNSSLDKLGVTVEPEPLITDAKATEDKLRQTTQELAKLQLSLLSIPNDPKNIGFQKFMIFKFKTEYERLYQEHGIKFVNLYILEFSNLQNQKFSTEENRQGREKEISDKLIDESIEKEVIVRTGYKLENYWVLGQSPDAKSFIAKHPKSISFYRINDDLTLFSEKIPLPNQTDLKQIKAAAATWSQDKSEIILHLKNKFLALDAITGKITNTVKLPKLTGKKNILAVEKINPDLYMIVLAEDATGRNKNLFAVDSRGQEVWKKNDSKLTAYRTGTLRRDSIGNYYINGDSGLHYFDPLTGKDLNFYHFDSNPQLYEFNSDYILVLINNTHLFTIDLKTKNSFSFNFKKQESIGSILLDPLHPWAYFTTHSNKSNLYRWDDFNQEKQYIEVASLNSFLAPIIKLDNSNRVNFIVDNSGFYQVTANGKANLRHDFADPFRHAKVWDEELKLWIILDTTKGMISFMREKYEISN